MIIENEQALFDALDVEADTEGCGVAVLWARDWVETLREPSRTRPNRWVVVEEIAAPDASDPDGPLSVPERMQAVLELLAGDAAARRRQGQQQIQALRTAFNILFNPVPVDDGSQRVERILNHVQYTTLMDDIARDVFWSCTSTVLAGVAAVATTATPGAQGLAFIAWAGFAGSAVQCGGNIARAHAESRQRGGSQALDQNSAFQAMMVTGAVVELVSTLILLRPGAIDAARGVGRILRPPQGGLATNPALREFARDGHRLQGALRTGQLTRADVGYGALAEEELEASQFLDDLAAFDPSTRAIRQAEIEAGEAARAQLASIAPRAMHTASFAAYASLAGVAATAITFGTSSLLAIHVVDVTTGRQGGGSRQSVDADEDEDETYQPNGDEVEDADADVGVGAD